MPCRAGAQLPIASHSHKPLLPPNHQCTSGSCLHTAEKTVSSIPSASDTRQWTQISVWTRSSPELIDGESSCTVSQYLLLSSLPLQELTGLSMVSYDPIQFHIAILAARQWTVQASASLSHRSRCFHLLLRSSLDQSRTLHSSWRSFALWHWGLVIATLTQVRGEPSYGTYSWIICVLHHGWIF